jgi:hypothetical protein
MRLQSGTLEAAFVFAEQRMAINHSEGGCTNRDAELTRGLIAEPLMLASSTWKKAGGRRHINRNNELGGPDASS